MTTASSVSLQGAPPYHPGGRPRRGASTPSPRGGLPAVRRGPSPEAFSSWPRASWARGLGEPKHPGAGPAAFAPCPLGRPSVVDTPLAAGPLVRNEGACLSVLHPAAPASASQGLRSPEQGTLVSPGASVPPDTCPGVGGRGVLAESAVAPRGPAGASRHSWAASVVSQLLWKRRQSAFHGGRMERPRPLVLLPWP